MPTILSGHERNADVMTKGTFQFERLLNISEDDLDRFHRDGFLIVECLLTNERLAALRESFPKLFAGNFATGVYPDEWYWREGMSLPDVTRHMANAWKADLSIAKLALSAEQDGLGPF
jgi:phytanoyl-CoA hydroxylase